MSWVIVSPACPSCTSLMGAWAAVQASGFRIIALEDTTLSACTQDLLWTLHVEALPAVHHEGVLRCGQVAVQWLADKGLLTGVAYGCFDPTKLYGTTLSELQSLRLLSTLNPPGTNSVTHNDAARLLLVRSWKH